MEEEGVDIDYLADVVLNQLLPDDIIPIIYIFDEEQYENYGLYRFVGIHLADTSQCLSFSESPIRNSPITLSVIVEEQLVEVEVNSYEIWHVLQCRDEDLCKILWMPTVHLDGQFKHIIDGLYDLIDAELAAEVIEDIEAVSFVDDPTIHLFNKAIQVHHVFDTGDYIWESNEIRKYAQSLNLFFNETESLKSIASAINALELKANDKPRNTKAEKEIDEKVRRVRLRLI